tara:strand:+ start:1196 stop:1456 length:261 start_codon:yes stop_codon:yes gene_type:complete
MVYRVLIDIDCLDALPKSGKRRDDVLSFCSDLANLLYDASDFQIKEPETSRVVEVSVRHGFIITWWVDAPVMRVVVIDVRPYKKLS